MASAALQSTLRARGRPALLRYPAWLAATRQVRSATLQGVVISRAPTVHMALQSIAGTKYIWRATRNGHSELQVSGAAEHAPREADLRVQRCACNVALGAGPEIRNLSSACPSAPFPAAVRPSTRQPKHEPRIGTVPNESWIHQSSTRWPKYTCRGTLTFDSPGILLDIVDPMMLYHCLLARRLHTLHPLHCIWRCCRARRLEWSCRAHPATRGRAKFPRQRRTSTTTPHGPGPARRILPCVDAGTRC
mgnify:CR=1 FL=1